jgi:hypothetical protein
MRKIARFLLVLCCLVMITEFDVSTPTPGMLHPAGIMFNPRDNALGPEGTQVWFYDYNHAWHLDKMVLIYPREGLKTFTPETTPAEEWQKLQNIYRKFLEREYKKLHSEETLVSWQPNSPGLSK